MVKTCDYLHLNNEIHFTKLMKMSEPCAGRKFRNKYSVKIILEDATHRSSTIATVYIYIYI